MTDYDSYTINSKNPLARFAHRSRLKIGLDLIRKRLPKSILDFGCGDGAFLLEVAKFSKVPEIIGFEPYMAAKKDATKLSIYTTWDAVLKHVKNDNPIDTIVCFEVMEHFSDKRQQENLEKISSIMGEDSSLIISVPIETGLVSLVKNIRRVRISYKGNENIYTLKNIMCSLIGIKTQEIITIRNSDDYLPHMGFYFTDFENLLKQFFILEQKRFSPFPFLPSHLNSQVFFQLKKRNVSKPD